MNVGAATGSLGSAAGAPLSQTAGTESERAQKEASAERRAADGEAKSERASGIGETEQDQQASERDADGRRLWEGQQKKKEKETNETETPAEPPRRVKDPTGVTGNSLDLTG